MSQIAISVNKFGVVETILTLVSILVIFPISLLDFMSNWKSRCYAWLNVINFLKEIQFNNNSVAFVRKRIIPTEWQPLVGEFSANFCGQRVLRGQCNGTSWPYSRLSRLEPLLFLSSSSSWGVDPVTDPLLLRKSGSAGNHTRTSGSVARNSDH
jgi:hypothetical protein